MEDQKEQMEKIVERFNVEFPEARKHYTSHVSHLVAEFLKKANEELQGFGVEGTLDENCGVDIQYVNMGDAYNLTVLYDGNKKRFSVSAWGDLVEEQEQEYEENRRIEEMEEMENEYGETYHETLALATDLPPIDDTKVFEMDADDSGESIRGKYVSFQLKGSTKALNGLLKNITEESVTLCREGKDMTFQRDMGVIKILPPRPEQKKSLDSEISERDMDIGR